MTMTPRRFAVLVLLLCGPAIAPVALRPHAQTRAADAVTAIRGATILTATNGTIQNARHHFSAGAAAG
jgi:hypothetical protein